ncbi:CRAL/TRIO domain-containing protein, partial [Punctularia strigosozonata HHB-11173 SS5]|uniref:CRAL/TRIO domain-containing protein n=1 Tax=Punctularia strigosozonata (strain HHB-11173) TaxID=741275 RepID=UPI0004418418
MFFFWLHDFADRRDSRFLRARQYNIPKAKAMLKNCREWRQTVGGKGIDDLYRRMDPFDYPERADVFKHWPLWFHKVDKKGRPVNVHRFGGVNVSELYKAVSPDRLLDSLYVNCESLTREILPACSNLAQRQIGTVLVIVDLKGFSIGQFWQIRDLAQKSFQISQDYYPETMGQVKIINAPSSFTAMWAVMKPWLAKETVDKIDVLGSDYQRELLAVVDADNLPASLGGNCTCDDCGGCAFSSAGPWMAGRKERREKWLKGERASIA